MSYLDTSVIIAYRIEGYPHHNKAVNIVEKLRQDKFYGFANYVGRTLLSNIEKYSKYRVASTH
jgi:hypothetical protein